MWPPDFWLIMAFVGITLGIIHASSWLAGGRSTSSLSPLLGHTGGQGLLHDWLEGLGEKLTYQVSAVTGFLVMLVQFISLPIVFLRNLAETCTAKTTDLLAKARLLLHEPKGPMDGAGTKRANGNVANAVFLALVTLLAVVVFAGANFVLLRMSLPVILPVERTMRLMTPFGQSLTVHPVALLALVIMAGEWLLAAYHLEFGRDGFVKRSKLKMAVCFVFVLLFAAFSAVLAVERTHQMNASVSQLSLAAIGVISFLIPLVASYAMGYVIRYLPILAYLLAATVSGLVALPFALGTAMVGLGLALGLKLVELAAAPFLLLAALVGLTKLDSPAVAPDTNNGQPPSDPSVAPPLLAPTVTGVLPTDTEATAVAPDTVAPKQPAKNAGQPSTVINDRSFNGNLTVIHTAPGEEVEFYASADSEVAMDDDDGREYIRRLRTEPILD